MVGYLAGVGELTERVGCQRRRRRSVAQGREAVHVLDGAEDVVVVERGVVDARHDEPCVADDDGRQIAGGRGVGLLLVGGDDQDAVVGLGPLDVAVELGFEPGVSAGAEEVIFARVGGVGRLFVGAVCVVQIVGDDEGDGRQVRIAGSGSRKAGEGLVHLGIGNRGSAVRTDVGELGHRVVIAHVEIGGRCGIVGIAGDARGGIAVAREAFGVTGEAEILAGAQQRGVE